MREILFRGRRVDNGEWIYGDLSRRDEMNNSVKQNGKVKHCIIDSSFVISETVGQYIGLKDCNGKMVFENDVLLIKYCKSSNPHWKLPLEEIKLVVRYCAGSCSFGIAEMISECRGECGRVEPFEVIGNVFENPELLEAEK